MLLVKRMFTSSEQAWDPITSSNAKSWRKTRTVHGVADRTGRQPQKSIAMRRDICRDETAVEPSQIGSVPYVTYMPATKRGVSNIFHLKSDVDSCVEAVEQQQSPISVK
jgi:hypothetical protein